MNDDVTAALLQLVLAVIGLATLGITAVMIPWIRARIGAERWQTAERMAGAAVRAVEQTTSADGGTKFDRADAWLKSLETHGINLSPEQRRILLEASVLSLRELGTVAMPPGSVAGEPMQMSRPTPKRDASGRFVGKGET